MTLLLSHRARRNALIFLMAIFTLGNVLSALSPDYTTLMLSRILTSLNHGAFFGLGSVVAASVVPKHKQAQRRGNHVYGSDHCQHRRCTCGHVAG